MQQLMVAYLRQLNEVAYVNKAEQGCMCAAVDVDIRAADHGGTCAAADGGSSSLSFSSLKLSNITIYEP